jgi:hypothetical protein
MKLLKANFAGFVGRDGCSFGCNEEPTSLVCCDLSALIAFLRLFTSFVSFSGRFSHQKAKSLIVAYSLENLTRF